METKNLWSWLIRAESDTQLFVPPEVDSEVNDEAYFKALQEQILANRLPVTASLQNVRWDVSGRSCIRVVVSHLDSRKNLIQFLTGLDRLGSFWTIEEKLYWEPPQLPPGPEKRVPKEPQHPFPRPLTGLQALFTSPPRERAMLAAYEYDRKQHALTVAFDAALAEWFQKIAGIDYDSRLPGDFERMFYSVLHSTVKQVIQRLFPKESEIREQKERERSRQELEAELERRKQRGFQA